MLVKNASNLPLDIFSCSNSVPLRGPHSRKVDGQVPLLDIWLRRLCFIWFIAFFIYFRLLLWLMIKATKKRQKEKVKPN